MKSREDRIKIHMLANKTGPYAAIMASRGYCEALVDGEDAVAYDPSFREAFERWPTDEFKTLRRETLNRQKYYNEMHEASERILKQFKVGEEKMTRDETIAKVEKVIGCDGYIVCSNQREADEARHKMKREAKHMVDVLAALGLIKCEEPKTPYEKLARGMGDGTWTANGIMALIDDVGLKLVDK